ncbi:serine hydrolase [Sporomusa sp.]|uniref:serine hydrolase domain-containing protein n=1 Tax=Sporomusa sp. TaxID=2078658 RepID=UPI002C13F17D|nr:serine hydrolase [Sporomusa sp.]HWR06687.1 serine hydrolase [Sporomusa sp.]
MNEELASYIDGYIKQKRYRLINSILLYKDSELVLARYYNRCNEHSRNNIKSIWKSIMSICAGICLDKGYIKHLDEPIANYLDEFADNIHPYHKLITIRHLLTMSSGIYWHSGIHYHCPMLEQLWRVENCIGQLADTAMANVPGTTFVYKEWDVILLSAIIGKATGTSAYLFCKENLYEPLGITSGSWAQFTNGVDYNISKNPNYEEQSNLSACDLAKIGFLFLDNGKDIISERYIREAVSPSLNAKEYGFLWWLFDGGYACRGYGGQELNILPEKNIVYVIQATPSAQSKCYADVFDNCVLGPFC